MSSVRKVAQAADVSIATVSRVLNDGTGVNDATRDKVLRAIQRTGYVRRVGKRSVAEGIALAYVDRPSVDSPFDHYLVNGIGRAMDQTSGVERFGNDLLILNLKRSLRPNETLSQLFLRKGVKGALLRSTAEGHALCERLADEGFPAIVVAERFDDGSPVSYVDIDSLHPTRQAVQHLVDLGHRRIGVAANAYDDSDHLDRISAWRDVLKEAGIDPHGDLIFRRAASLEAGVELAGEVANLPPSRRPTAMVITDPPLSFGMMRGLRERGWNVPGDLSIVGYDDGDMRLFMHPRLSAVCQDTTRLGEVALDLLRRRMADSVRPGEKADAPAHVLPPRRETLKACFEVGDTTAPPPVTPRQN